MSSSDTLNYISTQIYKYGYSFIFVLGLFGNTLSIIMFLTKLKENVCSFYLLAAEISDTLTLLIYVLPSIVGIIYTKNGTESNQVWCKLINWTSDTTNLVSVLTICLAAADRYLCSSRRAQLRKWSSMKIAKIAIGTTLLFSFLLTIPDFVYWHIDTNIHQCTYDGVYLQYASYFLIPVMFSFVPLITLSVFGYKTYRNLQQIHPNLPRGGPAAVSNETTDRKKRLDKQLSRMLIPQILLFIMQTTTFFTANLYIAVTYELQKSDQRVAVENLVESIIFVFYEAYTCASFYIYYTQSKTFRANVNKLPFMNRRGGNRITGGITNTAGVVTYNHGSGVTIPVS